MIALAAPNLTVPVFYAAGTNESAYASAAENMQKASTRSPDARLLIAPGTGAHGVALLDSSPEVADGVKAFLAKHAPAR